MGTPTSLLASAAGMHAPPDGDRPRGKRGPPPKPKYKRTVDPIGPDEAARERTAAEVWELMRPRYSREAREIGDAAARELSLADMLAIELATHESYQAASDESERDSEIVSLAHARMQGRKTLRHLAILLGPTRRARDERGGHELHPSMIEGTPEWALGEARRGLKPEDEILD